MTVPHPFGVSPPTEGALPLPQISSVVVKARPSLTEPFGGGDVDEAAYATLLFPSGREDGSPHVVAQMHSSLMHNTPEERCVVISVCQYHSVFYVDKSKEAHRATRVGSRSLGRRFDQSHSCSKLGRARPTTSIASRLIDPRSASLTSLEVRWLYSSSPPPFTIETHRHSRIRLGG